MRGCLEVEEVEKGASQVSFGAREHGLGQQVLLGCVGFANTMEGTGLLAELALAVLMEWIAR